MRLQPPASFETFLKPQKEKTKQTGISQASVVDWWTCAVLDGMSSNGLLQRSHR